MGTMARGQLTPAPMLGVTDMAAPTATVTDTDTDTTARGPLMPSLLLLLRPSLRLRTMPTTDTDTMARGPLMPSLRPGDTTAAHTDTDTATGTDTLMASKLPLDLVACHRTPMSSKYLSNSC